MGIFNTKKTILTPKSFSRTYTYTKQSFSWSNILKYVWGIISSIIGSFLLKLQKAISNNLPGMSYILCLRLKVQEALCFRPPVRPGRFPGIFLTTLGWNSLKFDMLAYPGYFKICLDFGHWLLIFLVLAPLGLSETGQISGFRAFSEEHMGGMT